MNIITHKKFRVKSQTTKIDSITQKWQDKKIKSTNMARKLIRAGFEERGQRMLNCSTQLVYSKCLDCGDLRIKHATLCRDKLCPICSWRLSLQRFANMTKLMRYIMFTYPEYKYAFITLTVPNCEPSQLRQTMKKMSTAWNRLTNRKAIKECVAGWARSVEITYNPHTRTCHPHYHIIAMVRSLSDAYEIQMTWLQTNRMGAIDRAQMTEMINAGSLEIDSSEMLSAVLETYKYSVKSKDLDTMPLKEFREFVGNVNGMRMTSFGGILKEEKANLQLEFEEAEEGDEYRVCSRCGGDNVIDAICQWSFKDQVYDKILLSLDEATN